MTARALALGQLLAVWDGDVVAPAEIDAILAEPDVLDADVTIERLRAAARADLGDIPRVLAALPNLNPDEVSQLARRLGWTVKALAEWDPRQDKPGPRIEAALASAAVWDEAGTFWEAARSRLEGARMTMAALEIVVRGRAVQTQIPENTPIWEREHFQAMQEAERIGDWAHLGERAAAFQRLPNPDFCVRQAITALALLDWPRLVRLADRTDSWLAGHVLLSPLPLETVFRLATASKSDHVRFTALERVVRREARELSPSEESALRNLLIVLALDEHSWPGWLGVCNRYPSRHPHMQAALGRALARSREGAFQPYVDSIALTTSDSRGRACVTHCLSEFRARAGTARRQALWRKAFERWQAWGFATSEDKRPLTQPATSALDYGVVGWFIEGEPQRQPSDPERIFEEGLRALEMEWHGSVSWAISGFLCLLSRHQILAHAAARSIADADWLPGPTVHMPAAAADPFVRQRYPYEERNEREPDPFRFFA